MYHTHTCPQFAYPSLWVVSRPSIDKNGEEGTISAGDYQKGDSAVRLVVVVIGLGLADDLVWVDRMLHRIVFHDARFGHSCSWTLWTPQAFFVGEANGDLEAKLGDVIERGTWFSGMLLLGYIK